MRLKFGKPSSKLINKIRWLQIRTKHKFKSKIFLIILNNTNFYPVLIDIITNY